jgi:hypothetical protein
MIRTTLLVYTAGILLALAGFGFAEPPLHRDLDDTGGFVHVAPGIVRTTNGCSQFSLSVVLTATDARVFGLRFYFDQSNLELLSVTSGADTTLSLAPALLQSDTLHLDGFFHPNFPAGSVTVAVITAKAVSPGDANTVIGFLDGRGFSGQSDDAEVIIFSGDTSNVLIEGSAPLPPAGVVILPFRSPPDHADSVGIYWHPVTRDIDGGTVLNPLYTVYCRDIKHDTTFAVGETSDTLVYNNFISHTYMPGDTGVVNIGMYWITACRTRP